MKFIIKKGSPLYKQLVVIRKRASACNKLARKLSRSFGATGFHIARGCLAGGISCMEFKEKPKGWVKFSQKYPNIFKPHAGDKAVWAKIKALPVVETEELAEALGFEHQTYFVDDQMHWIACPGVQWKKDFILVTAPEQVDFKALPGMKEILESEFIKLSKLK